MTVLSFPNPRSLFQRSSCAGRWSASLVGAAGLFLALNLGAADAAAADAQPGKKANTAKREQGKTFVPKPIEPLLSRDELRACMTQQKHNKEQAAKVTRLQSEVQAEKEDLQRGGEAMKAELAGLDRSDAEAVKAYNERSAARNLRIAEFEKRIDEFNASVIAFDEGRAQYGRDCENRKFDEKDEKALLQES